MLHPQGRIAGHRESIRDRCIMQLAILLLLCSATAPAQDASDILHQTAETYRALHGYEIEGQLRTTMAFDSVSHEMTWPVALVRADSSILPSDSPIPALSQTIRYNHAEFRDPSGRSATPRSPGVSSPAGWSLFEQLDLDVESPQRLPDETVEFEGQPVECWVVELNYSEKYPSRGIAGHPVRYWIDQATHLVLRQTFAQPRTGGEPLVWTFQATSAKLNEPLPDWALQTLPQEAGHELDAWLGRPAPAIDLTDLNGRPVSLTSLRGKVVLLNFWATWCGPCKDEMPVMEKLAAELAPRGLEVWGITNEPAAKARDWLTRYERSLPTLADENRTVFQAYEIETIPVSVVVDRDGRVASYVVGLLGEAALRAAVEKALARPLAPP